MDNKDTSKTIGYILGKVFVMVVAICLISIAIALTTKFIMWIF